jgi:hypothetical protein
MTVPRITDVSSGTLVYQQYLARTLSDGGTTHNNYIKTFDGPHAATPAITQLRFTSGVGHVVG